MTGPGARTSTCIHHLRPLALMRLGAGQSPSRAASLRGISHFPKDDVADVLLQAADWYNVDRLVKGALKQSLDGDKIEQVAFVCHFDQHINVGLRGCLAARHRAEDSNAGNVTLRELRLELTKFSEDFREGDHLRKGTAASGWKEAQEAGRFERRSISCASIRRNRGRRGCKCPRFNRPQTRSLKDDGLVVIQHHAA